MRELISLEDGLETLLDLVKPIGSELLDMPKALGSVLSENITASMNVPPFDRSPLDGYAVRSEDTALANPESPVKLKVVEEIPAGSYSNKVVAQNQTVKILTGAPIPKGADAVIRFEDVEQQGDQIRILHPVKPFSNYCLAGDDIRRGETVLPTGSMLGPVEIGVLAGLGVQTVSVFRKPRIGILSTGNELVDISETLKPGEIYNSNLYSLTAHVKHLGCEAVCGGLVPDSSSMIAKGVNNLLDKVDLLITTGGVSMGDYDLVKESLLNVGAELLFWRLNIRPGSSVVCSVKQGKPIIGLSGNPSAASVVFDLMVVPIIKKLMGLEHFKNSRTIAELQDELTKVSRQRRFVFCRSYIEQGRMKVKLTGRRSSGGVKSMLGCNALMDVPPNSGPLKVGDNVEIIVLSH